MKKTLQPADPDFDRRTRDSFARQPAMATLGAELAHVSPGRVVVALRHRADLTQQHGFLHAGIVATALDSACGYAAFTLMPADAAVLTIEFKINLLAPARGPLLRLHGRVVKAGRTVSVVEGRALQFDDDGDGAHGDTTDGDGDGDGDEDRGGMLVATMTATLMTVLGRGLQG